MTSGRFGNALKRTYSEQSYFGLLILEYKLRQQFVEVIEEGVRTYTKISTINEMANQLRSELKQSWRSIAHCGEGDRVHCIRRECSCSYADYFWYRNLRASQARLERRYVAIAKEAYELRATWQYVINPVANRLLQDREYRPLFLATLAICGDVSPAEADLAEMEDFFSVKLMPDAIQLRIGQDPVVVREVPTAHEPDM